MIITEIMEYLGANVAEITYDDTGITGNIFMGVVPTAPVTAVAVRPVGGYPADMKLDYDSPVVQVVTRGTEDPRTGYELALLVYDALHGFGGGPLTIGGAHVVSIEGIQSDPVDIGRDEKNRTMYSLNFALHIQRASTHRP